MYFSPASSYFRGYFVWSVLFFLAIYLWKLGGIGWIAGISDHLSNFALTGLFSLLFIGPTAFEHKTGRARVFVLSALFVVANLIVELAVAGTLGGFNVLDGYDALYGVAASLIVIVLHFVVTQREAAV